MSERDDIWAKQLALGKAGECLLETFDRRAALAAMTRSDRHQAEQGVKCVKRVPRAPQRLEIPIDHRRSKA
jgi:hypothetical protein